MSPVGGFAGVGDAVFVGVTDFDGEGGTVFVGVGDAVFVGVAVGDGGGGVVPPAPAIRNWLLATFQLFAR